MKLHQTVPELPVRDVEQAQRYFRDRLGFTIEWLYPGGDLGAVSHGDCVLFFRRAASGGGPGVFWIFVDDPDAACRELEQRGAEIVDPVADKPWGMRQFTVKDLNGNLFHFHHDRPTA